MQTAQATESTTAVPRIDRLPDDERRDWLAYWDGRGEAARDRLTERYWSDTDRYARRFARRFARRIDGVGCAVVDVDDCSQMAYFGLVKAVESWDGVSCSPLTWIQIIVFRRLQDQLRELDWVPRLVRKRKEPVPKIRSLSAPVSLHRGSGWTEHRLSSTVDLLGDAGAVDPSRRLELRDEVRRALRGLSRHERLVLILYYAEGLTMKQVGSHLGVSESRVSQMMASLMARLREAHSNQVEVA